MPAEYRAQLLHTDVAAMKQLLKVFGEAFADLPTYQDAVPHEAYLASLLASPTFIAVVARHGAEVVGGLAACQLPKFERIRREIYIYDLASPRRTAGGVWRAGSSSSSGGSPESTALT